MTRFEVALTKDANDDLEELYDYIGERDAPSRAEYVLDRIQKVMESLAAFPERGSSPRSSWRSGYESIGKRTSNPTA